MDVLFSKNDANTGKKTMRRLVPLTFIFISDQYDQLKKYISMFFNIDNDEYYLSYGQQQMVNIQETFFKSNDRVIEEKIGEMF